MSKKSSQEIIEMLRSSKPKSEHEAITYLHRALYNRVTQFILEFKGTLEDGEDVLQEVLSVIFKLAKTQKLPKDVDILAYSYSSCRNKWYRKVKKYQKTIELSPEHYQIPVEDAALKETINNEKSLLKDILESKLGSVCYQLLVYFYYEGRSMKEITALMSFGSVQVSKNRKSKCMKELRSLMQQQPSLKTLFQ